MNAKKILLLVFGLCVGPLQLTVAELQDKYDDSPTSQLQPDLLIGAWGGAVVLFFVILAGQRINNEIRDLKSQIDPKNK